MTSPSHQVVPRKREGDHKTTPPPRRHKPSPSPSKPAVLTRKPWGRLLNFNGPMTVLDLYNSSYVVGRSPNGDIVLENASVSKEHFRLYLVDGDMPCLLDTSTNGTFVNGQRILKKKVALNNHAEIEIKWDFFFVFQNLLQEDHETNEFQKMGRYYVFDHQTLGEGTYAIVKLAIDMKTGERLACKLIDRRKLRGHNLSGSGESDHGRDGPSFDSIKQEIAILKKVIHPNIVSIKDYLQVRTHVCIFLSRISGGELFEYILQNQGVKEYEAKFFFYQILRALQYLHERNITHRDLKPENLLLESPKPFSRVIITDFGMAKMLDTTLERMKTKCGTFSYLAPEILGSESDGYSQKVDCWSLGVLLFAMLSGTLPFGTDENPMLLARKIQSANYEFDDPKWEYISESAKDLISKLLVVDPDKRLDIEQTLNHPWIAGQKQLLAKLYAKMLVKSGLV